jgi:O-antigen/teichoic acid export membrane protein
MGAQPVRDAKEDTLFYLVKTVARHSAVYGVMNVLSRAASLVLLPLYVHQMTKPEFGLLANLAVTQTVAQSILLLGFNSALVRYYTNAETRAEKAAWFRTAFTTVLSTSAVALVLFLFLAPFLNGLFANSLDGSLVSTPLLYRLLGAILFLDTVNQMFLSLFRAQEKPFRYSAVNLTQFVLTLLFNVILVGVLNRGITGALIGMLSGTLAATLLAVFLAGSEAGLGFSASRFKKLGSFGFPLIASAIAFFVINSSDRYFLTFLRGLSTVGVYEFGYRIGLIMSVLVGAFVVAWPPLMYRIAREKEAPSIYARVLTYFTLAAGFVFLTLASFSPEIAALLAPADENYEGTAGFIWAILLSYLVQGIYYIFTVGVTITDKVKWIAIVVVAGAVVNVLANLALIPLFGMHGAAWATLTSFLTLAVLMWAAARHEYPMRWEAGRMARLGLMGGVCLVVNLVVIGHGSLGQGVLKLLVLLLLLALLFFTGYFDDEELLRGKQMLERVWKRKRISLP